MRVFVTGATVFVGSAVVEELIAGGHRVLGLARSDRGAEWLVGAGAEVHRGSLEDLESLRAGAAAADAVMHLAFVHDFANYAASAEKDVRAIEAMGGVVAGTDRLLLVTSGTGLLAPGRLALETDAPAGHFPRKSEEAAAAAAARGARVAIVRLPPSVHGDGDHGFIPMLIAIARQKGSAAHVGDGRNRWPAVHRRDAARLYRLALERGAAEVYHAVADEGVPFREIAEVIGRRLSVPVVSRSVEEAAGHFGWFARFAGLDCPASSARTREQLAWTPAGPGLMADIDRPNYFEEDAR